MPPLPVARAAADYNVSVRTLARETKAARLRATRIGNRVFYLRADLDQWVANSRARSAQ